VYCCINKKSFVTKEIHTLKRVNISLLIFKEKNRTRFVGSIVLFLLAVALLVFKIFDLTQVELNSDSSQIATDDDNNVQVMMFGFLAFIYI
jgi:hypothetical protein